MNIMGRTHFGCVAFGAVTGGIFASSVRLAAGVFKPDEDGSTPFGRSRESDVTICVPLITAKSPARWDRKSGKIKASVDQRKPCAEFPSTARMILSAFQGEGSDSRYPIGASG